MQLSHFGGEGWNQLLQIQGASSPLRGRTRSPMLGSLESSTPGTNEGSTLRCMCRGVGSSETNDKWGQLNMALVLQLMVQNKVH